VNEITAIKAAAISEEVRTAARTRMDPVLFLFRVVGIAVSVGEFLIEPRFDWIAAGVDAG
jgi:hypothetical protein